MTPPVVEGRNLRVRYAGSLALDVPQVAALEAEVLALIGPNGAGKSTLLRVLGLLERPTEGVVYHRGCPAPTGGRSLLALRRRFASVFQEPLLCDATVEANVALGLRLRGQPGRDGVTVWLERLGVAHLAGRHVRTLSGGEAQRVSLARAFAVRPEVLLLDEPFAALDVPTRQELLSLLQGLLRQENCTTVWVTHDREEALRVGDRIGVVMDGRLPQVATAAEVFGRPASEAVARFVGIETILPGRVVANCDGVLTIRVDGAEVVALGKAQLGDRVLVCLRPEDVTVGRREESVHADSARNRLPGVVVETVSLGPQYRVHLDCGSPLVSLVTKQSVEQLRLAPGIAIVATFKASAVHVIPH
jgi:tungstate transport system ATP-binding protein